MTWKMFQHIIIYGDDELDAAAKFLLLRFVLLHEFKPFIGGIKELAAATGLPSAAVTKSIDKLVGNGCLSRAALPDRKGRPTFEYKVREAYVMRAMERSVEGGHHFDALIETLLASLVRRPKPRAQYGKPPSRSIAKSRLSPGNIVLLCVYLSLADEDGVVRRKGASDLAAMAGLSKSQLKTHNQKLLRLGYLRTVVSGVSGQTLFGVSPGATYLNLQHPDFSQVVGPTLALVYPLATSQELGYHYSHRRNGEAFQLLLRAGNGQVASDFVWFVHRHLGGREPAVVKGVGVLLRGKGSAGIGRYLQHNVETYASKALSTFWGHLGRENNESHVEVFRWLLPQVSSELLAGKEKNDPGDVGGALVELVAGMSVELARNLRSIVHRTDVPPNVAETGGWEKLAYVILPYVDTSAGADYVILGRPKRDGYRLPKSQILQFERVNGNQFALSQHGVNVNDYENNELVKIGLLTLV